MGTGLPQDPTVGYSSRRFSSCHRDTCSTMFILVFFGVARNWRKPRRPSTDKENVVSLHNGLSFKYFKKVLTLKAID